MKNISLLLAFITISLCSFAQPEYFGCHYFKNLNPKPKALTDAEKALLDASIFRSDTFDIIHYDITIDVTDESAGAITAATTITYMPKFDNLGSIILDLFELQVDSVVDENGLMTYNYDDEFLQVYFADSPPADEEVEMTVYYHGEPHADPYWGGFYFTLNYIYNLGIGLTTVPPNHGKVWYPCFDTFIERATYAYHVKSADGKIAMCQGDLVGEEILGGDTIIRHFDFPYTIPTYLSAIAVSDYESYEYTHTGANGDIPVQLVARQAQMAGMQNVFQELGYAIDALEYWYGPYAWPRIGYILTTQGALEIPTNIAYPSFMTGEGLASNGGLFSHELGHHWWGDVVTLKTHNDMWIKEGPAEYSGHLFIEWKDGQEAFEDEVLDNQLFVLNQAHVDDNGFWALSPMPDEEIYGRHTYYKGASVIHNLRGYLGDDLFRETMHTVQDEYAYQSFSAEELRDILTDISGYDLTSFFDDQIFKPGFSVFVEDSTFTNEVDGEFITTVHIRQLLRECPSYYENVPLDVTLVDADWNEHHTVVMASGETTTVEVSSDFDPLMVFLNGKNRLNQARMDNSRILYPSQDFFWNLEHVEFRLDQNSMADSALIRIEHIWAGPDGSNLGPGIYEIAQRHYWTVDGIFPDEYDMEARINYKGVDPLDLDFDLVSETEVDLVMVYRENGTHPWTVYPDQTLVEGNPTTGTGSLKIDVLIPGEYALANGNIDVAVAEREKNSEGILGVFPNPAMTFLQLQATFNNYSGKIGIELYDTFGRLAMETSGTAVQGEFSEKIDIADLARGLYVVKLKDKNGDVIDTTTFTAVM